MTLSTHSQIFKAAATLIALILMCAMSFAQYTQTILHTFNPAKNGTRIIGNPMLPDGDNLYGTTFDGGTNQNGTFFELTPRAGSEWQQTVLFSFPETTNTNTFSSPVGGMVRDASGNFYGVSPYDGESNCYSEGYSTGCGTIWKLAHTSQGWKRTILYSFTGGSDQGGPAGLIRDSAGNLYGVTNASSWGTVFELSPNGASWSFKTLYAFTGGADGATPVAVVLDRSGNLLGATNSGGVINQNVCSEYNTNNFGCGVVFELSPASGGGWSESTLYSFLGESDGAQPYGSLALDGNGNLFGVAGGGSNPYGEIFEVSHSSGGWTETVPYSFTSGVSPFGVTFDTAGNLYGTTQFGGLLSLCENGCGTVFELSPVSGGWSYNTLYSFTDGYDGESPSEAPVLDAKGNLFVATYSSYVGIFGDMFLDVAFELSPASGKWRGSVVRDFPSPSDGFDPVSSLVRDSAGNLYGTTPSGGAFGWGTVFEVIPSGSTWTEKILYSFLGAADGALPRAGLALDAAGNLYGDTEFGGNMNCSGGCGTVFKLSPSSEGSWSFSVLHTFKNGKDGDNPNAGVILDAAGDVYGTSQGGTSNTNCVSRGCGTVFKLSPTPHGEWNFTLLYVFANGTFGGVPALGTLVMDAAGNLYGCNLEGGTGGYGVVYELSPQTSGPWKETVLYNVSLSEAYIQGTLALDQAGDVYGTSNQGGTYNHGTVFELTHSGGVWTQNTIYSFTGNSDGGNPVGGVVFDSTGNLFGVTAGSAYELSPVGGNWQETTIFAFNNLIATPAISLVVDPSGNLFGTIPDGNAPVVNAVYELTP
jgi:uncharacterized repeat protein (TIGR03803 family)